MCQFLIYKIAQALALVLPLKSGYAVATFFAKLQFYFSKRDRLIVYENLKAILPSEDDKKISQMTKEVFANFAKYLVDFFRFSKLDKKFIEDNVKVSGTENLEEALKRGRGGILLAAHLGNYELGAAATSLLGYPFNAVALKHKSRLVTNFFIKQRHYAGIKVISLGAFLRKCFEVLRKNELLALVGDRDFSGHGMVTEFFGRNSLIPKGPSVLSLKTGALIIPSFLIRMPDDTFRLIFEKPIAPSPTDNFEKDVARLTSCYLRALEERIKQYPSQWYMFVKFWK